MQGIEYIFVVFGTIILVIAIAADNWYKKK